MKNKILWGLQGFVALAFFAPGSAKLAGVPMMVATFEHIGIGQWFRYVTALLEISGAIVLLTPRFSGLGAILLACIMFCATLTHLLVIGGNPAPAIVLFILTATIASQRAKTQLTALLKR